MSTSPLANLEPIPCPCYDCRLTRACDVALDTNSVVDVEGTDLMVVPDVIIAEGVANGLETLDTHRAVRADTHRPVRADGRTIWLFRRPKTGAPAARAALSNRRKPTLGAVVRRRSEP
jgi:hypothetical protein